MAKGHRAYHKPGITIPLAVVAGFIPMVSKPLGLYLGGSADQRAAANWWMVRNMTGINKDDGKFDFAALRNAWLPVAAGFLVHKIVGGKLGVNRMLARSGVPLLRI